MSKRVVLQVVLVLALLGFFLYGELFREAFIDQYVAVVSEQQASRLTGMIIYGEVSEREVEDYLQQYTALGERYELGEISADEFLKQSTTLERKLLAQDVSNTKPLIDAAVAANLTSLIEEQRKKYEAEAYQDEWSPGTFFLLRRVILDT